MKIAIIGAGFCGVAVAFQLLQRGCTITLYDANGIGGGASGIAAGLMHPYAGRFANYNWRGDEGMAETNALLKVAADTLGYPVSDHSGLLRMAVSEDQKISFKECASQHSDVLWQTAEQARQRVKNIVNSPGIYIPSAVTVNCPSYLKGLWSACEKLKGKFENKRINDLTCLDADRIIITTGAHRELHNVPLTQVKGQILEYDYSQSLPLSINSQAYIVTKFGSCLAGATFEKTFAHSQPDLEIARKDLEPKILALYPELAASRIINCRAGLRASCKGHLPLIQQIDSRTWVLTGMGSKGLLYHALMAKELCGRLLLG